MGYAPEGGFHLAGTAVSATDYPELVSAVRAALFCNDVRLRNHDGVWQVEGDPTEGALLALAVKGRHRPDIGDCHSSAYRCHSFRVRASIHGDAAPRP